tara:strand:- start:1090 stop:1269 length:180 start_codon:yes stop_codon:yes gene_type:complete
MDDKEVKKIKAIVQDVLEDLLFEEESPEVIGYGEENFPIQTLDEMEAFLGHPIDFMGIS